MMIQLALSYGLMSLTLYTGAWKDKNLDSMARILVCGTVICISLGQLA